MASLGIRFFNAARAPLEDELDVTVTAVRTNTDVARERSVDGTKKLRVTGLTPLESYAVRALPVRHRPVGQFAFAPAGEKPEELELFCPVDPQRVSGVRFPVYADLDATLRGVLEQSTLERDPTTPAVPAAGSPGETLYGSLTRMERAGLLNLFCKMSHVPLGDVTAWSYVQEVYRIRGDRIFVNVALECRDRVKNAVSGGGFKEADSSLHTPPDGFAAAGSFKTRDRYGNLQLTFFGSVDAQLRFKVDADIDDAAGIEHAFQVLDHFFTKGETHPFDIHEILTFHQRLNTGYELEV
jgi:hypothetical protein